MTTKVRYDTWERWVGNPTPPNQRRGQYLWNNAPAHITAQIDVVMSNTNDDFDPFYAEREDDIRCQRFMLYAYLMWDEVDADPEDVRAAREIVQEITSVG